MAQPSRLGMTDVQKSKFWQRWRKGESIIEISRALAADRKAVVRVLSRHSGFTPLLRKRSPQALTLAEREEISRGLSAGNSLRQIADAVQRSPSTISRRSPATAVDYATAPLRRTKRHGRALDDPKYASWLSMVSSGGPWLISWRRIGRLNRYRAG